MFQTVVIVTSIWLLGLQLQPTLCDSAVSKLCFALDCTCIPQLATETAGNHNQTEKPVLYTIQCTSESVSSTHNAVQYAALIANSKSAVIQHRSLTLIPNDNGKSFSRLRHFDLAYNSFSDLPSGAFRNYQKVEFLSLRSNRLRRLDDHAFEGLKSISILDLSSNELTATDIRAGCFQDVGETLTELYLHCNPLGSVSSTMFVALKRIQRLNLAQTGLATISGALINLNSLKYLVLSGNNLEEPLREAFLGLSMLEGLELANCSLRRLYGFSQLSSLKTLNLDANLFTSLTSTLMQPAELEHLVSLTIRSCNKLEWIESDAFAKFPNLESLDLSDNPELHYANKDAFGSNEMLKWIGLRNNKLLYFEQPTKRSINTEIDLSGNPLLCDCVNDWLHVVTCENDAKTRNSTHECPPKIYPTFHSSYSAKHGHNLRIDCISTGQDTRVYWVKMRDDESTAVAVSSNNHLRITEARMTDAGWYTCYAANQFGDDQRSTYVEIVTADIRLATVSTKSEQITVAWSFRKTALAKANSSLAPHQTLFLWLNEISFASCDDKSSRKTQNIANYSLVAVNPNMKHFSFMKLTPRTCYEICVGYEHKTEQVVADCLRAATTRLHVTETKMSTDLLAKITLVGFVVSMGSFALAWWSVAYFKAYRKRKLAYRGYSLAVTREMLLGNDIDPSLSCRHGRIYANDDVELSCTAAGHHRLLGPQKGWPSCAGRVRRDSATSSPYVCATLRAIDESGTALTSLRGSQLSLQTSVKSETANRDSQTFV